MKRKIYNDLLRWKQRDQGKVAILLEGARRVGKSYIVEEFARNEYKSYILVNFAHLGNALKAVFDNYLNETETFLMFLQNVTDTRLYERDSLIIFDEVQKYPLARQAIKHLVADGRYDYIETGSLVSINENTQDILLPSEERSLMMYPMDFEEFLWAIGDEMTIPFIRQCFEKKMPMGPMHRKAITLFRQYLIVGGMPQAVLSFIETKNFQEVDRVKRDILNLYRRSIDKHSKGYREKVKAVFNQIPGELQKHEKRFRLADLSEDARFRSYETSFLWLQDAEIINMCYNVTEPQVGMKLKQDSLSFKCYMADTGLLISHAFDEKSIQGEELYQKLLLGKLEINAGMLVENIVAQMLAASGHKLYFYSNPSRENAEDRMEIDFLVEKPTLTNAHNICPVEVKSSKNYTLSSLKKFRKKFNQQLASPYVIHYQDYKEDDGIVYLPIYMTPML
ncbi:MAG: ATP-binding protein [Bacteroidales bacterium]|nr:ATP-binding protein [Bacteroidales bacterium]